MDENSALGSFKKHGSKQVQHYIGHLSQAIGSIQGVLSQFQYGSAQNHYSHVNRNLTIPFYLEKINILGRFMMRIDVYNYLEQNKELLNFMHEQPIWYRKLSRDPSQIEKLEIAALHYYQKTIPHHVEKFSNGVQMASMMVSMFQIMNAQS